MMTPSKTYHSFTWLQRFLCGLVLALALLILPNTTTTALDLGAISSLSASVNNDVVTVSTTLRANVALLTGNLYIEVRTPNGVVIGTKSVNTPTLLLGQTWSNNSAITVSGWPENGNYSVTACWTIGLILDCALTTKTTTFFHVPGLGLEFTIFGVILLAALFWHAHKNLKASQTARVLSS